MSPVNQDAQVVSTAVLLEQCPRKGMLLEQCPSGQHSSAVGLVVGMSTMIPNMCPPYVQQDDVSSVSTNVGQEDPDAKFQVGQVSDSRVGSMKTKLVSSRSSGVRKITSLLRLSCQLCSYWLNE